VNSPLQRIQLAAPRSAAIALGFTLLVASGCSQERSKTETIKEETKTIDSVEQTALQQNRYLNADEVKKVTQSFEKIAESTDPERAAKIRAFSDAVKAYRAKLEEFKSLGGAKVETLQSEADLDRRMSMLNELIEMSTQVKTACAATDPDPSNLKTLGLERELLEKISEQLKFYKAHYGKWQVIKNGPVRFEVSPDELAGFNKLAGEIKTISEQQMEIMKRSTQERMHKASTP